MYTGGGQVAPSELGECHALGKYPLQVPLDLLALQAEHGVAHWNLSPLVLGAVAVPASMPC